MQPLDLEFCLEKSSQNRKSSSYGQIQQCHHCLEWIKDLKTHMALKHGQELPYVCNICNKGYVSMSGLNHHLRAHKGKQFSCPICDTRFIHRFHIKSHLRTAHKSAQCVTCSGIFLIEDYNSHLLQCRQFLTLNFPVTFVDFMNLCHLQRNLQIQR